MTEKTLKPGWRMVKFGDVVRQVKDVVDPKESGLERYIAGEHLDTDDLHLRRWGVIGDDYLGPAFHMRFKTGQVLYGSRRTYLRKVALADFEGICANTTYVLESKDKQILLPDLLPFIMQTESFHEHSIKQSKGSVNPYINFSDIAWYEFPLPPLDEQRRIADLLWAMDAVVSAWGIAMRSAEKLLSSILNIYFKDTNHIDNENWQIMPLERIAYIQTGVAKGKVYGREIDTMELPYLSVLNVQDGYLNLNGIKYITIPKADIEKYRLKDGDVLITEGGDFDKVGRGSIWRGEIDVCLHQNHIFCIRVDAKKLLPEFLSLQMRSSYGKAYFLKCAKKTSNLASINSTQVKQFPVILNSIDVQREIVELVSAQEQSVKQISDRINSSIVLKKNLLRGLIEV